MSDRRSTICKKWVELDGRRTICGMSRGHEGLCTFDVVTPSDDDGARDRGPFEDVEQAMQQFARWEAGLPSVMSTFDRSAMGVNEALLLAGVVPSDFEREYLQAHGVDPVLGTIIAGWLLRAAEYPSLRARRAVTPDAASVAQDTPGQSGITSS